MALWDESACSSGCAKQIGAPGNRTAAHVSDISQIHELLHGMKRDVFADTGYQVVRKRPEIISKETQPQWHVAAYWSKIRALLEGEWKETSHSFRGQASMSEDRLLIRGEKALKIRMWI